MKLIKTLREFQLKNSLTSYEIAGILSVDINKLSSWYSNETVPEATDRYRILRLIEGEQLDSNLDIDN